MAKTLQVTYSGKDSGGYVWQNVFHVEIEEGADNEAVYLSAVADVIDTAITDALAAAMADTCAIYDLATKVIFDVPSYSFHKVLNRVGDRDVNQDTGAIAGKIVWFPVAGNAVGHQFITGVCEGDYESDVIQGPYEILLAAVKDAFLTLNGTAAPYVPQLTIYNKVTNAHQDVASGAVLLSPCILSKRIRA